MKTPRFWLLKGNPAYYDWDKWLRAGREENWGSRFVPAEMAPGDRLLLWESGGKSRLIGMGVVARGMFKIDGDGTRVFRVRYLTGRLPWMPTIDELRHDPVIKNALFLKPAVFRTVYPLTPKEASRLYSILSEGNPAYDVWKDVSGDVALPDVDFSANEGATRLVHHLRRERDPHLVAQKKAQFQKMHGKLRCEACDQDFSKYGALANALFEVHHRKPLGTLKQAAKTRLSDLAVLCSNCHRVIHRHRPLPTVAAFRKKLMID